MFLSSLNRFQMFSSRFRLLVTGAQNKYVPVFGCLENTDLENADLENADLENTDLENADLENADP